MSPPQSTGGEPVVTPHRVLIALCLAAPFVAMLWVSSYDSVEPRLIGIPFFYWYQMLWVPLSTLLTCVAYVLLRRDKAARKRRREVNHGE